MYSLQVIRVDHVDLRSVTLLVVMAGRAGMHPDTGSCPHRPFCQWDRDLDRCKWIPSDHMRLGGSSAAHNWQPSTGCLNQFSQCEMMTAIKRAKCDTDRNKAAADSVEVEVQLN